MAEGSDTDMKNFDGTTPDINEPLLDSKKDGDTIPTKRSFLEIILRTSALLSKRILLIFSAIMFNAVLQLLIHSAGDLSSSHRLSVILSLIVPFLLIMIATIVVPLTVGNAIHEHSLAIVMEIAAHVTGWAFVVLFEVAEVSETLESVAIVLVSSLLLCILYSISVDWLRQTHLFTDRIRSTHDVVEVLTEFDQEVISYVLGYLSFVLGLKLVVNAAESEDSGKGDGDEEHEDKDEVNISSQGRNGLFMVFFMIASALLLLLVEKVTEHASHPLLEKLPKSVTQMCAVGIGFIISQCLFIITALCHGYYTENYEEVEEYRVSTQLFYIYAFIYSFVYFVIYNISMYRRERRGHSNRRCTLGSYLRKRIKTVMYVAIPIAIGQIFEVLVEYTTEEIHYKHGWLEGVVYFLVGVISTIVFIYTWEPEDAHADGGESDGITMVIPN